MKFRVQISSVFYHAARNLPLISGFLSAIVGTLLIGPPNLWPTEITWLTNSRLHVDAEVAQIAWSFFRTTKIFQWPLTKLEGYPDGHTFLLQTGAGSPLFGIPLKYLNFLLPDQFQYIGSWIVTCFFLQGYFSAKIFREFQLNRSLILISSGLLVFSPIFIHRIGIMGQLDMAAHWIILAAIYQYIKVSDTRSWVILNCLALFVGPYISVMVFGIWVARMFRDHRLDQIKLTQVLKEVSIVVSSCIFTATALGYHTYQHGSARGPGFFRLNVAAFFNPSMVHNGIEYPSASKTLGHFQPLISRQFVAFESEGFNFLGISALFIILIASAVFGVTVLKRDRSILYSRLSFWAPIFTISLVFLFFAFSNQIVVVRREFSLPSNSVIDSLRTVFRSATRFAWPISYLTLIVSISLVARSVRRGVATWLIALLLVFQICDSEPLFRASHQNFVSKEQRKILESPEWNDLAAQVESVKLVPTFDYVSDNKQASAEYFFNNYRWFELINFAASNHLSINFAYSGRPSGDYIAEENSHNLNRLIRKDLETKTLYVFPSPLIWNNLAITSDGHVIMRKVIDGYFLAYTQ